MKYPKLNGYVGFRGDSVRLAPCPDDHPIVAAFPDLFTDTPPPGVEPPKRRGRPPGSKNKVEPTAKTQKSDADDG